MDIHDLNICNPWQTHSESRQTHPGNPTCCVRKVKNDADGVFCSADPCLVHASEKFKVCALADGTLAVLMFQAPAFFDEGLDDGCDRAFR